jgi:hypothetical protein
VSAGSPWTWERSHGGALASVGHLLGEQFSAFQIASTYSASNHHSWGSTLETDHLFSSRKVAIAHIGADSHREQKIRFLSEIPMAQQHLRVCWDNRSAAGNCSQCPKCVATMLLLAELGALDRFVVFKNTASLPAAIDALPYLPNQINIIERLVHRQTLPRTINEAARRLVARSRRAAGWRTMRQRAYRTIFPNA